MKKCSPQLQATEAGVAASRSAAVAAGRLPDPTLTVGIDNFPVSGPPGFTFNGDDMTMVRVGIGLPQTALSIGGGAGLLLSGPDGGGLTEIPAGSSAEVKGNGTTVRARVGGLSTPAGTVLTVRSVDSLGYIRVNGRDYRGS